MKNAAAFRATYSDWRLIKGRKVVQVVFELPLEAANEAYAALGGMPNPAAESWFAIARLVQSTRKGVEAETNEAHSPEQPALGDVPARAPKNKLAQLAGMLGKEPLFHHYLKTIGYKNVTEETAVNHIRDCCRVKSRSQILPNTDAAFEFMTLYDDFVLWRDADKFVEA